MHGPSQKMYDTDRPCTGLDQDVLLSCLAVALRCFHNGFMQVIEIGCGGRSDIPHDQGLRFTEQVAGTDNTFVWNSSSSANHIVCLCLAVSDGAKAKPARNETWMVPSDECMQTASEGFVFSLLSSRDVAVFLAAHGVSNHNRFIATARSLGYVRCRSDLLPAWPSGGSHHFLIY